MCKCTPEIRTPFCGNPGCEWDNVNHPPHYTSSKAECPGCKRRIECIDITRHLKKAIWYIQNEIDKT